MFIKTIPPIVPMMQIIIKIFNNSNIFGVLRDLSLILNNLT